MLIVSDTGPLRYLVEVGCAHVLPRLYGQILTTPQVIAELQLPHFPAAVRAWANSPPPWLLIESPVLIKFRDVLDEGEATALSLALERHADVLLVDERRATRVARESGVATAGTLAVLRDAGLSGLIDFHAAVEQLTSQTRFRHDNALIDQIVKDFESRKSLNDMNDER